MRRRNLLVMLGAAAFAWPLAVRAQPGERMRRIGVLSGAANDPNGQAEYEAFLQGLQQLGWTDGSNLHIDVRWSAGNAADTRKYATELIALGPNVIMTTGTAGVAALLGATRTVPIVFALVPDPVGAGFVDSLAQPGGNATGFMMFEYSLAGKWLSCSRKSLRT